MTRDDARDDRAGPQAVARFGATVVRVLTLCLLAWLQIWTPLVHAHVRDVQTSPWHLNTIVHGASAHASQDCHSGSYERYTSVVTTGVAVIRALDAPPSSSVDGGCVPVIGFDFRLADVRLIAPLGAPSCVHGPPIPGRAGFALPPAQGPPSIA